MKCLRKNCIFSHIHTSRPFVVWHCALWGMSRIAARAIVADLECHLSFRSNLLRNKTIHLCSPINKSAYDDAIVPSPVWEIEENRGKTPAAARKLVSGVCAFFVGMKWWFECFLRYYCWKFWIYILFGFSRLFSVKNIRWFSDKFKNIFSKSIKKIT